MSMYSGIVGRQVSSSQEEGSTGSNALQLTQTTCLLSHVRLSCLNVGNSYVFLLAEANQLGSYVYNAHLQALEHLNVQPYPIFSTEAHHWKKVSERDFTTSKLLDKLALLLRAQREFPRPALLIAPHHIIIHTTTGTRLSLRFLRDQQRIWVCIKFGPAGPQRRLHTRQFLPRKRCPKGGRSHTSNCPAETGAPPQGKASPTLLSSAYSLAHGSGVLALTARVRITRTFCVQRRPQLEPKQYNTTRFHTDYGRGFLLPPPPLNLVSPTKFSLR